MREKDAVEFYTFIVWILYLAISEVELERFIGCALIDAFQ
jgi:hypothetical protein